jgi:hypothetical protein
LGKAPEDVMDKFQILSSPNVQIMISLIGSNGKGGVIDSIMNMKQHSTIEYIYSSIFPRQRKENVHLLRCWWTNLEVVRTSSRTYN